MENYTIKTKHIFFYISKIKGTVFHLIPKLQSKKEAIYADSLFLDSRIGKYLINQQLQQLF